MQKQKLNTVDHLDSPFTVYKKKLPCGGTIPVSKQDVLRSVANFERCLPDIQGKKTIISNYVGTFWTHIMGPQAFAIYFQLTKMAYGEKDYAFPSTTYLAELTGMSPRTVQRNMLKLIELEFVIAYEVQDARNNTYLSNLYFLSNTIPYINEKQYKKLPKRLQEDHDKFMEHIKNRTRMRSYEEPPTYDR